MSRFPQKPAKPIKCPWCRESPEIWPLDPKTEGDGWACVVCTNKDCPTHHGGGRGVRVDAFGDNHEDSKRKAIALWNKARTPPPAWMFAKKGRPG